MNVYVHASEVFCLVSLTSFMAVKQRRYQHACRWPWARDGPLVLNETFLIYLHDASCIMLMSDTVCMMHRTSCVLCHASCILHNAAAYDFCARHTCMTLNA